MSETIKNLYDLDLIVDSAKRFERFKAVREMLVDTAKTVKNPLLAVINEILSDI